MIQTGLYSGHENDTTVLKGTVYEILYLFIELIKPKLANRGICV